MLERLGNSRLGRWPLGGLLIPPCLIAMTWQSNLHRLPIENVWPTFAIVAVLSLALLFVCRLFAKTWVQAGLIQSALTIYLLFAPALIALVPGTVVQGIVLAALFAVTMDVVRRIPADSPDNRRVTAILNVPVIPATGFVLAAIAAFYTGQPKGHASVADYARPFTAKADENSPDVWHLIFDRYAGLDPLKRVYDYDNTDFLDALRARGFSVTDPAVANYQRTGHSLSSTLNGIYLDDFAEGMAERPADQIPIYRGMTGNAALQFFNAQGYETVFSGSWWDATRNSPMADVNLNTRDLPEIARVFLGRTVIGKALEIAGLPYGEARADQCARIRHKFGEMRKLAASDTPKYVFGHFLVPHPPYVIKEDGTCRSLAEAEATSRRDNYIGQLVYTNRELLALVDAILAGPRRATIVLSADEGPWPAARIGDERYVGRDPSDVDWRSLDADELKEKMQILMATRFHDGASEGHPVSPVNIYPAILANGFGGRMEPLPERNMIFLSKHRLYDFRDVTDVFRDAPALTAGLAKPE